MRAKIIEFVNFGSFPGTIMFTQGFTYEDLIKHLKRRKSGPWLAGALDPDFERLYRSGNWFAMKNVCENKELKETKTVYYISIPNAFFNKKSGYDYARLAHEVLHITCFHLRDVLDRDVEVEAEAYTHTHVMMQILKHLDAD